MKLSPLLYLPLVFVMGCQTTSTAPQSVTGVSISTDEEISVRAGLDKAARGYNATSSAVAKATAKAVSAVVNAVNESLSSSGSGGHGGGGSGGGSSGGGSSGGGESGGNTGI